MFPPGLFMIDPSQDLLADERTRTFEVGRGFEENWSTVSEALDIFNARHLANNWTEGKYPVEEQCAKDITRYLEGLRRNEGWALKGTCLKETDLSFSKSQSGPPFSVECETEGHFIAGAKISYANRDCPSFEVQI